MALETNLVANYGLENLNDNKGGFNLTNNNSVVFVSGYIGNAADSGASNTTKSLSVANNLGIDGGACSINCWIKLYAATFATDHPALVDLFGTSTQVAYRLGIDTIGLFAARLKSAVAWQQTASAAITANAWHMVTLTYDGTNINCYLDNVAQGAVAASGNGSGSLASGFALMAGAVNPVTYTSEIMDEVSIWSRGLVAADVTALWNGGLGMWFNGTTFVPPPKILGGGSFLFNFL